MDRTTLTQEQIDGMLERAAEAGARRALLAVGLHDADAAGDVRDLRGLLDAFRMVKTTVAATVVKGLTLALLAAILAAVGLRAFNR